MRRRLAVAVAALAALLVAAGSPATPPTYADPGDARPLRLMIAGDSISHEFAGDYTWRYRLRREFSRQHVYVDFVGPITGDTHGPPLIPWSDDQHYALGGTVLAQQAAHIAATVTVYHPDVVLVMTGFNDLNHGHSAAYVVSYLHRYLHNLFTARLGTRVILSPVLRDADYPSLQPRHVPIGVVNAGYRSLVSRYAAAGRDIQMVDERTAARWQPGRVMTWDGVHPTPTGEMVIAHRYAEVLHEPDRAGTRVLPEAPGIPLGYTPWLTLARPVVRQLAHRRIEFRWDYAMRRLFLTRANLYVFGGGRPSQHVYGGRLATSVIRSLPRGQYGVRLSPVRKWLVGRWGPMVRFTVH